MSALYILRDYNDTTKKRETIT